MDTAIIAGKRKAMDCEAMAFLFYTLVTGKLHHFKNGCRSHTARDAHGYNAPFCLATLQLIEELGRQLGARGA